MKNNLSFSALRKHLAGISSFLKLNGFNPIYIHFLINQSLKGYKKKCIEGDSCRPITFKILGDLCSILPNIGESYYEGSLFWVAFALALANLYLQIQKSHLNYWSSDIICANNSLKIFIKRSMTDQLATGSWLNINMLPDSNICPFRIIHEILKHRSFYAGIFLFVWINQDYPNFNSTWF